MARIQVTNPMPHHLGMRGATPLQLVGATAGIHVAPEITNPPGSGHPENSDRALQPAHLQGRTKPFRKVAIGGQPMREYAGGHLERINH